MRVSVQSLVPYIRRIVYALSLFWICFLYYQAVYFLPDADSALAQLTRNYGLTALFLFFVVLAPGLLEVYFPRFFLNPLLNRSRRAVGISLFFFALLHSLIGFFFNLGGNLFAFVYLNISEQFSLILGTVALLISAALAMTSFDWMVQKLTFRIWKKLHRLVYPAVFLVLFHTFLIGSHFTNPTAPFPILIQLFSMIYILLEIGVTLRKLEATRNKRSELRNTVYQILLILIFVGFLVYFFNQVPHHVR